MHKWIKYLRSHGQQTTEKLTGQRQTFARLILERERQLRLSSLAAAAERTESTSKGSAGSPSRRSAPNSNFRSCLVFGK